MIRQLIIREFGPEGLSSTTYDAPGAMCVVTVPGLTPVPARPPIDRPLYVVAGDYEEFRKYILQRNLRQYRDAVFFSEVDRFHGLSSPRMIFTGSWRGRDDLDDISHFLLALMGTPHEATVEFHPLYVRDDGFAAFVRGL